MTIEYTRFTKSMIRPLAVFHTGSYAITSKKLEPETQSMQDIIHYIHTTIKSI